MYTLLEPHIISLVRLFVRLTCGAFTRELKLRAAAVCTGTIGVICDVSYFSYYVRQVPAHHTDMRVVSGCRVHVVHGNAESNECDYEGTWLQMSVDVKERGYEGAWLQGRGNYIVAERRLYRN